MNTGNNLPMMFDPVRIARLHLRTSEAIDSVQRISASDRSGDPSADHALACCRQIALTLSEMWLPMLRDIMALHSFSHYESVLRTGVEPGSSSYSSRFGSRSAGRVRANEMRRERARRAAEVSCHAPWLRRAPHHQTSWTWADLRGTLNDLNNVARMRQDPTSEVRQLSMYLRSITSEVLSDPQGALAPGGPGNITDSEVATAIRALMAELSEIFDPTHPSWIARFLSPQEFSQFRETSGESLAIMINLVLRDMDETQPPHDLLVSIATNPTLLSLIEPHLELLDNSSISLLVTTVLEYDRPVSSSRDLSSHGGVTDPAAPILREILSREGGYGALAASPAATAAFIGRRLPPQRGSASAMTAALNAGSTRLTQGLSAERIEQERKVEIFEFLATYSGVVGVQPLEPQVSRFLALAFAPILDDLAPFLDREHLVVTVQMADPSEHVTVRIGTRQQVASAFGRIMDDEPSQLIFGVAAGQIVAQRPDAAAQKLITSDRDIDAVWYLQSELALGQQVSNFLSDSRAAQNQHLSFEHGLSTARKKNIVNLLTIPISVGPIHINTMANLSTPGLLSALGADTPPAVPSFGLDSDLAILHTATALKVPLDYPELRARLGVDDVPAEVWQEVEELLLRLEGSTSPEMRSEIMSQITAHVHKDPSLQGYLNAMRSGSGAL